MQNEYITGQVHVRKHVLKSKVRNVRNITAVPKANILNSHSLELMNMNHTYFEG